MSEDLIGWNNRMRGAAQLVQALEDSGLQFHFGDSTYENKAKTKALLCCLKAPGEMHKFLEGGKIEFYDIRKNSYGWISDCLCKIVL